jgi:hypothetical protein
MHTSNDIAERDAGLYNQFVIEEIFFNEHVATGVAEMIAEQEAWGNAVTEIQVFDSLIDAVHAAILAHDGGVATLKDILNFCGGCRWLYQSKAGGSKVDSMASYDSAASFERSVRRSLTAHRDQFDKGADGYRHTMPYSCAPQTTVVDLPLRLQQTSLWFELTQKALRNRTSRIAKKRAVEQRPVLKEDVGVEVSVSSAIEKAARQQHEAEAGKKLQVARRRAKEKIAISDMIQPRLLSALGFIMGKEAAKQFCGVVDKRLSVDSLLSTEDSNAELLQTGSLVEKTIDLGTCRRKLAAGEYVKVFDFAAGAP